MRKTLKNVIVEKKEEIKNEVMSKQQRLEEVVTSVGQIYKTSSELSKKVTEYKNEIKSLFLELNLKEFVSATGSKVTMTAVDKSTVDSDQLINYLKEHNLEQFIHTREYIDESEIAYAVAQNVINAADLGPMTVEKTEYRLNIK